DVLVGQGGLAAGELGDPFERERSAVEDRDGGDAVSFAERREVVEVEVVLAHQDVEGGEAETVAPAVVQALDAAAVDLAVEDRHRMALFAEVVEQVPHRL